MNRRGSVFDMFVILGILFLAVLIAALSLFFINTFTGVINNATGSMFDSAKTMTTSFNTDAPGVLDFILLMLFIGLPLFSMILAFFNNIHPVFFYASFGMVILIIFVGAAYGQLWGSFADTDIGTVSELRLPMTSFILNHFGLYALLATIMILFGTYVKLKNNAYGY